MIGDDLGLPVTLAGIVVPRPGLDPALDRDLLALAEELAARLWISNTRTTLGTAVVDFGRAVGVASGFLPTAEEQMNLNVMWRGLVGAVILSLAISQIAIADFATARRTDPSAIYDGITGNQGIRTDPATVVGVGYVHIVQADVGAGGGDFVAIGTANGVGAGDFCADDYDPKWTIYVDRVIGGAYQCYDYTQDAYGAGANPTFEIRYKYCVAVHGNRWVLTFAGVQRTCIYSASTGATRVLAGLETTGDQVTDRNIDVRYTNMLRHDVGGLWVNMNANEEREDPSYRTDRPNSTQFDNYLPPLD